MMRQTPGLILTTLCITPGHPVARRICPISLAGGSLNIITIIIITELALFLFGDVSQVSWTDAAQVQLIFPPHNG